VLRLRGSGPQDNAPGKAPGEGAQLDKQVYADANLWVKRQMAALEERKKQVSRTRQLNPELNRTSGRALASILYLCMFAPNPCARACAVRARESAQGLCTHTCVYIHTHTTYIYNIQQRRKELQDEEDGLEPANVTNVSNTATNMTGYNTTYSSMLKIFGVSVFAYLCVCMCVYTHTYLYMYRIYVCISYLCVHTCIFIYVYMYVCVCICV
jgi:hypothetical protein